MLALVGLIVVAVAVLHTKFNKEELLFEILLLMHAVQLKRIFIRSFMSLAIY